MHLNMRNPLLLLFYASVYHRLVDAQKIINSTGTVVQGDNATVTTNNGTAVANPSAFATSLEFTVDRKHFPKLSYFKDISRQLYSYC